MFFIHLKGIEIIFLWRTVKNKMTIILFEQLNFCNLPYALVKCFKMGLIFNGTFKKNVLSTKETLSSEIHLNTSFII